MYGDLSLKLRDVNEHLVCGLCGGYFIDATTIIECLHSFCRSCIVTYLASNKCCPKCEIPAHKTRPLLNIRSDKTLQDVVYKLVPNLLQKELERKEKFHDETGIPVNIEEQKRTSVTSTPEKKEHRVSLSIEFDTRPLILPDKSQWVKEEVTFPKRYLRCFDAVTIGTINKLIRSKLSRDELEITTFCRGELLPEKYTLMDVTKTFGWKSDRPFALTYMAFSPKGSRKRKILENIANAMEDSSVPKRKLFKEDSISKVSEIPNATLSSKDELKNVEKKTLAPSTHINDTTVVSPQSSTANIKSVASKLKSSTASTRTYGNSQNGTKNMSYSVMNVPLLEAVTAPKAEASRKPNLIHQHMNRNIPQIAAQRRGGFNEVTPQSAHVHPIASMERPKSINSIANRLQIKQMQSERARPQPNAQNSDSRENIARDIKPTPVSLTSTETVAAMKRQHDQLTRRLNASNNIQNLSTDEAHSLALECVRNTMMPTSARQGGVEHRGGYQRPVVSTPNASNTKFIQLKRTVDLPNYAQATEQMRRSQLLKQTRSKYQEIQPKPTAKRPESRPIQHTPRTQKPANIEDQQLLSTTRQLASLRQQQKILNEIAAAMAGRTNQSIPDNNLVRTSVSNLSPRMASPRRPVTSHSMPANPPQRQRFSNPQTRFSLASPQKISQPSQHIRNNVVSMRPVRQNGVNSSNFSRMSTGASRPILNSPRDGNIDIYQHTIAKARDTIRQMDSLKNRASISRIQGRSAVGPYQIPQFPKKVPITKPSFAPRMTQPVPIAPKPIPTHPNLPSPKVSPQNVSHNAGPSSRNQYVFAAPTSSPYAPNRRSYPPPLHPTASNKKTEPPVTISNQPEQEQPLCLVVKK